MNLLNKVSCSVKKTFGKTKTEAACHKDRLENMTHKEIDKTLKDSFPASDPPGNY